MTTVTDVEQALINARVLEEYWMSNGWESLVLEEEEREEILDIYPIVEVDISVTITIKLPNKIYAVPLEDVSPINVNNCLVIGASNLYPDWEERVESSLGDIIYETSFFKDNNEWKEYKYIGKDSNFRVVKRKIG